MTKAEQFDDNSGEITLGYGDTERVFHFTYTDACLMVTDDSDDIVCNRSLREDNGEEKNAIEAFGIAVQEVGGYFD